MNNCNLDIVDFHSHILPGADHGSASLETSLAQLDLAKRSGVTRIIATPHFYPHKDTLKQFLDRRARSAEHLNNGKNNNHPEVKLGAEVLLCDGLEKFDGLEMLCLSGTNHILLELPFVDFREEYCDTVRRILKGGFDVILAHVDRYPKENIERMLEVGVQKFQLNAASLDKLFKPKHLIEWSNKGYVVALGSDIHGTDSKAYKHFIKAKIILEDSIETIRNYSDDIFNQMK